MLLPRSKRPGESSARCNMQPLHVVLLQLSFKPKKQPKPGTELSTTVNCYALFDFKTVTIFSTHKSDYVSKNQWT
jgi:hypothetical protein